MAWVSKVKLHKEKVLLSAKDQRLGEAGCVFGGSEKQKSRGESKDHQGKQGWWIQTVLPYHRKLNGVGLILKEEYVTVTLNTPTEA